MGTDVEIVRRAYAAFARRDLDRMLELVDPQIEFWTVTAEETGRDEPYLGADGMRRYFADADAVWDELRLVPHVFESRGDLIVATGRVYARRGGQVIDSSAGWHWRVRDGRIVYGRVFRSGEEALAAANGAPGTT
ncbi:MAG: nuclear transport factor 2 family protein [Thermoleophilaceae bacterium]